MDRLNLIDRFKLYYNTIFYKQVNTITAIELDLLICQRQWVLPLYVQAKLMEFIKQA